MLVEHSKLYVDDRLVRVNCRVGGQTQKMVDRLSDLSVYQESRQKTEQLIGRHLASISMALSVQNQQNAAFRCSSEWERAYRAYQDLQERAEQLTCLDVHTDVTSGQDWRRLAANMQAALVHDAEHLFEAVCFDSVVGGQLCVPPEHIRECGEAVSPGLEEGDFMTLHRHPLHAIMMGRLVLNTRGKVGAVVHIDKAPDLVTQIAQYRYIWLGNGPMHFRVTRVHDTFVELHPI